VPAIDISPRLGKEWQRIESYGGGGFKISGQRYTGSLLVFPTRVVPWSATTPGDVTMALLGEVTAAAAALQVLLIGCGRTFVAPPVGLLPQLREAHTPAEWMDTGAACRTYNVLLLEGRRVAAALIAVD
jgi:uncharacterized protein